MTRESYPVHFANFICHFGDAELLDYLKEVVVPAFVGKYRRSFKDTRYFFHDVQIIDLHAESSKSEPAICGRFVKDMVIHSEQKFVASTESLEKSNERMESAPSAVFALLLNSHKLLYLHETSSAPGLESFRSTVESFLKQARHDFVDELYERFEGEEVSDRQIAEELSILMRSGALAEDSEIEAKVTKKRLRKLIPVPNLEVVPLANEDSLKEFVGRFKVLQAATVRLLKRNSELDNDDFFESIREKGQKAGAETAIIVYKNPEGLAKRGVVAQLEAALTGNAEVKLEGKDDLGQQLRGSNDEFKVVAQLKSRPSSIKEAAVRMLNMFRKQEAAGLVRTGDVVDVKISTKKIRRVWEIVASE